MYYIKNSAIHMHFKKNHTSIMMLQLRAECMYILINKAKLRLFQRRLWWMLDGIGMDGGGFISIYF